MAIGDVRIPTAADIVEMAAGAVDMQDYCSPAASDIREARRLIRAAQEHRSRMLCPARSRMSRWVEPGSRRAHIVDLESRAVAMARAARVMELPPLMMADPR